MTHNYKTSEY